MGDLPLRGWTAKELAARLHTSQTKLYHHLALLETRGFIVVADTRMVSGIVEKRYQLTAVSFRVDRSLLAGGGADEIGPVLDTIFDKARTEILAGQRAGLFDLGADQERRRMGVWATRPTQPGQRPQGPAPRRAPGGHGRAGGSRRCRLRPRRRL